MLQENTYTQLLTDDEWIATLASLSDIFVHLNELKRKMQGKIQNIEKYRDIPRQVEVVATTYHQWIHRDVPNCMVACCRK
jgi:hypothetical protein